MTEEEHFKLVDEAVVRLHDFTSTASYFNDLAAKISKASMGEQEEWMATQMASILPPDMFLRAYGNDECKRDVSRFLEENGYALFEHPDRIEIRKHNEVLSTYSRPKLFRK